MTKRLRWSLMGGAALTAAFLALPAAAPRLMLRGFFSPLDSTCSLVPVWQLMQDASLYFSSARKRRP